MRLELALVVGILLFCSWCAYIVARMSWSVNAPGQVASAPDQMGAARQQQQQLINHTQGQILIDQFAQFQRPPSNAAAHPYQTGNSLAQQQARQFEASEPAASRQHWAPQYVSTAPNQLQQQQQQHYSQPVIPLNEANQWRARSLPTAATGLNQVVGELEYYDDGPGAGQGDEGGASEADDQTADDGETAATSATGDDDANEDDQQPVGADYDDYERQPAPVQNELEEVSNRRSFSELESDSRERDKDGHLVKSKRRHLINGKPVLERPHKSQQQPQRGRRRRQRQRRRRRGQRRGQQTRRSDESEPPVAAASQQAGDKQDGDDADENSYEQDEEEAAATSAGPGSRSERDFEGMVREIDLEDRLQRTAAARVAATTARQPNTQANANAPNATGAPNVAAVAQVERRSSEEDQLTPEAAGNNVNNNNNNGGGGNPLERTTKQNQTPGANSTGGGAERDSHEHRVQETLVATKWDDETPSGSNGTELTDGGGQMEELNEQEDEDQVGNIVERDREAQQLEGLARRALTEAARMPDELERRRRRREAGSYQRADGRQTSGTESLRELVAGATRSAKTQKLRRRRRSLPPDPGGSDGLDGGARAKLNPGAVTSGHERPPGSDNSSTPVVRGTNSSLVAAQTDWRRPVANVEHVSRAPDSIGGSEDMHVAVLADPPPPPLVSGQAIASEWPISANSSAGLVEARPVAASPAHVWNVIGLENENVGRHLALGSHKRRRRIKRKRAKRKRSQVAASKYKAARAYANKHRKRMKKGDMHKRRRKSHKHSEASRKQFEGLTRGKRLGRGHKLEGAKKRSALVKDKGYKKRGFKKSYHKLETGDHKTYFDEFRDNDHKKRWKDFDDTHKYSQKKKWSGYDSKHHHRHKLDQGQGKAAKAGKWRERSRLEHSREANNKYKATRHKSGHGKVKRARKE